MSQIDCVISLQEGEENVWVEVNIFRRGLKAIALKRLSRSPYPIARRSAINNILKRTPGSNDLREYWRIEKRKYRARKKMRENLRAK